MYNPFCDYRCENMYYVFTAPYTYVILNNFIVKSFFLSTVLTAGPVKVNRCTPKNAEIRSPSAEIMKNLVYSMRLYI